MDLCVYLERLRGMAMRRYAIYVLLFLLSLAVFGCTRVPQVSFSGPVFPASLQRPANSFDGRAARLPQPTGLQGPLLSIAPESAGFLMPEPVRLSRSKDGTIQLRHSDLISVSGLIPEYPRCTAEFDELSGSADSARE